jgi:chloramphenicol 3-O-phosphotransferase
VNRAGTMAGRHVVLLNGPAGVGKTTVGRRLAATARNGVCVHGDDLKRFVVTREPGAVEQGLSYVGGAALTDVFLRAGYDLVVFEFVFERRIHVDRFLASLRTDAAVHLVTLWAPWETVATRELGRPERARRGDRVAACWNAMAAPDAGPVGLVDMGEMRRHAASEPTRSRASPAPSPRRRAHLLIDAVR